MENNLKSALTMSTLVAVLAAGTVFYAHAAETQKAPAQSGMMGGMMQGGHGDMMGMMNMMQQMNQMMESCNTMMKDTQQRAPVSPQDSKKPASKS